MRITFLLPCPPDEPSGGFRVVYEYANRLSLRGHCLTIIHGPRENGMNVAEPRRITEGDIWFRLDGDVRAWLTPTLDETHVPRGDAIIATAWTTAPWVAAYSQQVGPKYYLVQHHETWWGSEDDVNATWQLPLHKVVIARWLWDLGMRLGQAGHMTYIPNGIDLDTFHVTNPPESRRRATVALLNHMAPWKGTADGLAALELAKATVPDLEVLLFGTPPPPADLPDWVTYVHCPVGRRLVELYNACSIFLHASWNEGWGLPALEAMACGCALVATLHGGSREFVTEDVALPVPPHSRQQMAVSVTRLVRDDAYRLRLATAGASHAAGFGWPTAVDRLENLLMHGISHQL